LRRFRKTASVGADVKSRERDYSQAAHQL